MSGECQTKNKKTYDKDEDEKPIIALDEGSQSDGSSFTQPSLILRIQ